MARTTKGNGKSVLPMHERTYPRAPHWALLPFVAGILIGLTCSTLLLIRPYAGSITNVYIGLPEIEEKRTDFRKLLDELQSYRPLGGIDKLSQQVSTKAPVYYAVLMSDRHLSERLEVLKYTWARDLPAKDIGYFIPAEEELEGGEKVDDEDLHYGEIDSDIGAVVELPTSHLTEIQTLRYICKHKINDTKWFFLSNENIYVKTRALEAYLQQYENINQMGYLGKPVKRDPIGRVCMPGPGTILSYSAMTALCPKLDACMAMDGKYETECVVGECIRKSFDLQCNKEGHPEPQELFLKFDASKQGMITEPANHKLLETALTVYPMNDPKLMYHIHQFVVSRVLNDTQHELQELKVAVDRMTELLPQSNLQLRNDPKSLEPPVSKDDIDAWKLINHAQLMSCEENNPALNVPEAWKEELNDLMRKSFDYLNSWSEEHYVFKKVVNAYWKVNPFSGIDYIVDFEAKKADDDPLAPPKQFRVTLIRSLNHPEISPVQPYPSDKYVNIAVFLTSEQLEQFQGFMQMLENVLSHDQRLNLLAVQMRTAGERQRPKKSTSVMDPKSILSLYETKYPKANFKVIDSSNLISRSHGISLVIRECKPSEIIFVADLDLEFDTGFIERCRNYPLQGQQVYFPTIFAKSDPALLSSMDHTMLENIVSPHSGYWLVHSYSTACIHAADILASISQSGFKGIPAEVSMTSVLSGLLEKKYEIIRSTDKGLKRAYSQLRTCDLDFTGEIHDPCEVTAKESHVSLYVKTQLGVLLFDHEGEHSETKF